MRSFIILLCLIVAGKLLYAQEVYPNCTNPKKIKIPFVSNNNEIDKIYYQLADEYTYWYQISAESDCVLEYEMTVITESDDYGFLIYKHQGDSFCNNIVNYKIKSISNLKKGVLTFKKGESYFLNMVYLSGNGCGHKLLLKTGENNMNIKAIQNECVEEVMEEIVAEVEKSKVLEVVEPIVKFENKVKGLVINSKTKKSIEATVLISAYNDIPNQQIHSNVDSGFVLNSSIGDEIIVSVKKMGYKTSNDTISIDSASFIIELDPINIGEKLIMNKVYFHPNTYVLKDGSEKELNKLLEFMLENKSYSFEIQGHTNGKNRVKKIKKYAHLGEGWNFEGPVKKLSKLRAEKIKTFLIKNGIPENQLQTEGYGGDKMIIVKPKNMAEAMKNIRVEVIVLQ